MRAVILLTLGAATTISALVCGAPLGVIVKEGEAHVAAATLEREAGIVIKKFSGRGDFVACSAERCAPLKSVSTDGDTLLIPVAGLSEAMNLTANFDESRRFVTLVPKPRNSSNVTGPARLGSIAPNLRLTKLDGTTVTLDELRGQRVLINSWASW